MNMIKLMRSKHLLWLFLIFFMLATLSSFLWLSMDAVQRHFSFTATEVMGADGSIESNEPLPQEIYTLAKPYQAQLSLTYNFPSMAIAKNASALSHIRAVEPNFPLKGKVQIKLANNKIIDNPKLKANEIWIDDALKTRLAVELQDDIQLGKNHFTLTGIIVSEPARAGATFTLAPKIIIRTEDLPKTDLVQPYSRVLYQLFVNAQEQKFREFTQTVKKQFPQLKIYSVQQGRPFANSVFRLAERYMGIFIVLTVILSGLGMIVRNVSMKMRQFPLLFNISL